MTLSSSAAFLKIYCYLQSTQKSTTTSNNNGVSMLKDSREGYGLITIIFHWVCAGIIIFLFGLGVYMSDLDYYSPWYHKAPWLHVSIGLLLLSLMILRVLWRTKNLMPEPLPTTTASANRAASLIKIAFYIFIFTLCITGYLITTAEGKPASFFDLFGIPATLELNADNVDLIGEIHEICAWSLIAMAILHAGAALFHNFVKKDRTLLRMLTPAKK